MQELRDHIGQGVVWVYLSRPRLQELSVDVHRRCLVLPLLGALEQIAQVKRLGASLGKALAPDITAVVHPGSEVLFSIVGKPRVALLVAVVVVVFDAAGWLSDVGCVRCLPLVRRGMELPHQLEDLIR